MLATENVFAPKSRHLCQTALDLGASRFSLSLCADRPDFRARGRRSSGEAPE